MGQCAQVSKVKATIRPRSIRISVQAARSSDVAHVTGAFAIAAIPRSLWSSVLKIHSLGRSSIPFRDATSFGRRQTRSLQAHHSSWRRSWSVLVCEIRRGLCVFCCAVCGASISGCDQAGTQATLIVSPVFESNSPCTLSRSVGRSRRISKNNNNRDPFIIMDDLDESKARDGMPDDINISDVIEVLATDPDFNPKPKAGGSAKMFNGGEIVAPRRAKPTCVIAEQPASKALRFRYECEGRSAGSIPGVNSTPENKTFPTIQVQGYQGRAVVVVSCVTKDPPYRPHPHNLVGREGCKRGVCTLEVPPETMTVTFSNLGIQCVKKKDIESALKVREEIRVDPFRTGYGHRSQPTSIDLNAVRLCFQVFLQGEPRSRYTDLTPVVSDPIYDKKAMADLVIVKLSDCVCPVDGGNKDIILLCEKISKEDIQVRFYEEKDGQVTWEGLGEFQPSQVHKQTAIWFKPPKYRTMDVREPVKVNIQLRRPSDGATSLSLPFQLLPLDAGIKRRGEKLDNDQNIKRIFRDIQERDVQDRNRKLSNLYVPQMNIPLEQNVKDEPNDASRSPYAHHYLDSVSPPQPYPSTSPLVNYYANYVHQPQNSLEPTLPPLPPCNQLLPNTTWNIPSTSYAGTNNLSELNLLVPETSTYLNMDTQQSEHSELRLISLNSGDLPDANPSDMNNLTENLSANLSLTDIQIPAERMTDSLDRLANNEFAKHYE